MEKNNRPISIQSIIRKAGWVMLSVVGILVVVVVLLIGFLWIKSPGKVQPILDEKGNPVAGSISEKEFIQINGIKQGMFIQSKDPSNPVLLYLHGGMPDYVLTEKYPTGLEDYFTIVWWEQRGSGISYSADIPPESMTLEQMILDTVEVTKYLQKRFGKEKIYLMGHSGGTFIGIQAAARQPELYYAYLGVAQMADQLKSEQLAYEYMLQKYKDTGDMQMVRKLEAAPVSPESGTPLAYRQIRDGAMHELGIGTTHDMNSIISGFFLPSLASPQYTLAEKINMWRGKSQSGVSILWEDMISINLSQKVPELKVPVYFFEGVYDYTCAYSVAKAYYDQIKAPVKGFYTFEKSAHSPFFEEPELMIKIIQEDVLTGKNSLADK